MKTERELRVIKIGKIGKLITLVKEQQEITKKKIKVLKKVLDLELRELKK